MFFWGGGQTIRLVEGEKTFEKIFTHALVKIPHFTQTASKDKYPYLSRFSPLNISFFGVKSVPVGEMYLIVFF